MHKSAGALLCLLALSLANSSQAKLFDFERLHNYTRLLGFGDQENNNELWRGIIKDCSQRVTFSCIQKNAYTYLDNTLLNPGNVTVFEGFSLIKNNLDYDAACVKEDPKSNLVEDGSASEETGGRQFKDDKNKVNEEEEEEEEKEEERLSPLEEVTHALRSKAIKFLATRDYQIKLPGFIGAGAGLKISPREIDENGALVRIDFDMRAMQEQQQGRLFFIKKIKKQIQNKLFTGLLLLILLIKIIKLKFMFVIPFLFGVGTAKKLFLKLLLFLVPAFGHVFKLCSSYYSTMATKYHTHHHKVAHHHHHIPVPVPVPVSKPVYYDHPPPSHSYDHPPSHPSGPTYILDEDFNGYDYAHPHIQYRKDMEELKEWGIEPYDEPYDQPNSVYPSFGHSSSKPNSKISSGHNSLPPPFPGKPPFVDKLPPPPHPQSLAYSAYAPPLPPPSSSAGRQPPLPVGVVAAPHFLPPLPPKPPAMPMNKPPQQQQQQQQRPVNSPQRGGPQQQQQPPPAPAPAAPIAMPPTSKPYDDEFYGPIVERLDETFNQLRFLDENCRERLVCSMYKNPALYAPHSNLVSNELSRDPQELQQANTSSLSSQRFLRYLNAARLGQDGGDCLRSFHCSINTEK